MAAIRDSHSPGSLGKSVGTTMGQGRVRKVQPVGQSQRGTGTAWKVRPEPKCNPEAKRWKSMGGGQDLEKSLNELPSSLAKGKGERKS